MTLGLRTLEGPTNHVLDGVKVKRENVQFWGKEVSIVNYRNAVSYAKMAEPIEMAFGLCTRVDRRKHVLHGGTLAQPGEYD